MNAIAILHSLSNSERADDLPLIIHWLKQMEIASIIDQELPAPHGNRKGLSDGQLSVLFLSYVVTQSDHRFNVYHQPRTEEETLLNFGYSKDRRPDLVQYRQMLATLDPMGMPLLGATLPGNKTDESDYLPTWRQLAQIIGNKDFLFLADSKASTWNNRALIDTEGGIYCFPLAMVKPRPKLLSQWLAEPPTAVEEIYLHDQDDSPSPIGKGFEVPLGSLWYEKESQNWYRWSERWLVVCSYDIPKTHNSPAPPVFNLLLGLLTLIAQAGLG